MSVISTMVVRLTADTGTFRSALKTSSKDVTKWGKTYKAAQAGAAAGLTAIAGVATKSISTYKEYGGAVNKLTGLMNVSTEDASRLVGQWKRFGIESATGTTAVKILSKNIDAARGGNAQAAESFARLGISMADLKSMSAAQVMMKARDAMSQMEDKTARTSTMLKLFGRSGTEMLGWVKQAPGDIAGVNDSLGKLGLVWGDKQLETYKDLAKAQGENKLMWLGFQMTLAQTLIPTLTSLTQWFGKVLTVIQPIAPYLKWVAAGLAGFLIAGKIASAGAAIINFAKAAKIAAAVQWLWNAAMTANPIGLIIVAIAALVAGLVLAYKKVGWFRAFVQAAFKVIGKVAGVVFRALAAVAKWAWDKLKHIWAGLSWLVDFFRKHWRLILSAVAGPLGLMLGFVIKNWSKIKAATAAAWSWVKDKIATVAKAVWKALTWYSDKWKDAIVGGFRLIKSAVGAAWDWVRDKTAGVWGGIVNTVVGFVNRLIKIINYLPGVNIGLISVSSKGSAAGTAGRGGVAAYAQGVARVSRPTLALIGEDGPEAVLPLSKPARMKAILGQLGLMPSTGMAARGQRSPAALAGIPAFADGGIVGDIKGFFGNVWGGIKGALGALRGLIANLSIPNLGVAGMAGFLPEILRRVWASVKDKFNDSFGKRGQIVGYAKEQIGKPYVWGATGPNGFDCSGLVYASYRHAGVSIPRIQVYGGQVIPQSKMQPADVLLYNPGAVQGGVRVPFGHYKMYAGNGQTVEAGSGGVHMAPYAPAAQIRTFLNGGWHGAGGTFVATRPTIAGFGERGPERVSVTPLGGPSLPASEPSVYLDFTDAIFVDSTRAGVERLWNLAVRGGEIVETRREKVSPS